MRAARDTRPSAPPEHVLVAARSGPRNGSVQAGPSARLVVVAGPRRGVEIPVGEGEVSIGRAADSGVVLPDIAVSRRHAVLRREGERYFVEDQGSGNGTRVNGRLVRRARLLGGDELALGDSVLRFVEPGRPAPRSGPVQRWRAAATAAAIVASGLALAVWPARDAPGAARTAAGARRPRSAGPRPHLAQEMGDALPEPRDRRSDEVPKARSMAVAATDASLRPTNGPADANEEASASGPGHGEANQRVSGDLTEGTSSAALRPAGANEGVSSATVAPRRVSDAPLGGRSRRERHAGLLVSVEPDGRAIAAYLSGDMPAALDLARSAPRTLNDLRTFEAARREAQAKTRAGDVDGAIRALEGADAVDRALAGDRVMDSTAGRQVRHALAQLHLEAAARDGGADDRRLPLAAAHLRAALAYDRDNEAAQRQLAETVERAREIYLRGYVAKDSDPAAAREAFRVAAASLPPGDDTAQKARRWMERLEGRKESAGAPANEWHDDRRRGDIR